MSIRQSSVSSPLSQSYSVDNPDMASPIDDRVTVLGSRDPNSIASSDAASAAARTEARKKMFDVTARRMKAPAVGASGGCQEQSVEEPEVHDFHNNWDVFIDPGQPKDTPASSTTSTTTLTPLITKLSTDKSFFQYHNNVPLSSMCTGQSIYLFKHGFVPRWEDRRCISGGSWIFSVHESLGPELFLKVQLLAVGEQLEGIMEKGDMLCGVGLSVGWKTHKISVWHRNCGSNGRNAIRDFVLEEVFADVKTKGEPYYRTNKEQLERRGLPIPVYSEAGKQGSAER